MSGRWLGWLLLIPLAGALAAPPEPLLWQARGEVGTVYLLGSFHMLGAEDHPLDPRVESAYARAERLVFEVDPAEMAEPETLRAVQAMGRFEAGDSLRGSISAGTLAALRAFVGSDAALATMDAYKPWYLGLTIAVGSMSAMGLDARFGLDQHFMQRAAADGKPVAGLETAREQMAALDRAPMAEQDQLLAEALEPLATKRERIGELRALWRAGDAAGLERAINADMREQTPQTYILLNRERNRAWLPQILDLLQQSGTSLVIVGSMHLLGPDGLVEMLRRRGVKVERIRLRVLEPLDEAA